MNKLTLKYLEQVLKQYDNFAEPGSDESVQSPELQEIIKVAEFKTLVGAEVLRDRSNQPYLYLFVHNQDETLNELDKTDPLNAHVPLKFSLEDLMLLERAILVIKDRFSLSFMPAGNHSREAFQAEVNSNPDVQDYLERADYRKLVAVYVIYDHEINQNDLYIFADEVGNPNNIVPYKITILDFVRLGGMIDKIIPELELEAFNIIMADRDKAVRSGEARIH